MDRTQFLADLRTALMQLNDFRNLRRNPLLTLLAGPGASSPLQLQQVLLDAIESLRRAGGAAHAHEILYHRYVEQIGQEELAFQLGMSVRQLRRQQGNALELLAEALAQKFDLPPLSAAAPAPAADTGGDLHEEFAWLQAQFSDEAGDVRLEFAEALRDVAGLAQHHQVTVQPYLPPDLPKVAVPALVLRQALLTTLALAVAHAASGAIDASGRASDSTVIIALRLRRSHSGAWPLTGETRHSLHMAGQLLAQFGGQVVETPSGTLRVILPAVQSLPILVIEDNPDTRRLFQRYVEHSRFRLLAVDNCEQALALAQEMQPRAVVLDIMMPGMDGWDVLARLQRHPATAQIPVAVCSILPQPDLASFFGAAAFLQKPVNRQTFLETLARLAASAATTPG